MKVKLDEGAYEPTRSYEGDAGLDLRARYDFSILPYSSATHDTGVHLAIPHGYFGKIESKSGLNVVNSTVSCGGVIDEGYTGSVCVKLYNFSNHTYRFSVGQKIAQLIIQPYIAPELELVDELSETERGNRGFGSSGK